ncbi:MAG: TraR/DksA C4-type zinc finger protein [Deltaproteobacteria bacterium]|nr:MAG: TraR/DksA C4-type zinc finger protein [Deltaproteobacteria bacterium]
MTKSAVSEELIQQTIRFHGHSCPGLAIGIRASELALATLGRASDEEIVAVVETDMCGVDAVQFLAGCTFGKGNLIHLDYGKNAFTFYRRSDGEGFRIVTKRGTPRDQENELSALRKKMLKEKLTPEEQEKMEKGRAARVEWIMDADPEDLFEVKPAQGPIPKKARILQSLVCEACGEATMESRTRRFLGQTLCIPCFEAMEKRE